MADDKSVSRWQKIWIAILLIFVVWYPYEWIKRAKKNKGVKARSYVNNYRGQPVVPDPWGKLYEVKKYNTDGGMMVMIRSAGVDGEFGTDDDVIGGYLRRVTVEIIER